MGKEAESSGGQLRESVLEVGQQNKREAHIELVCDCSQDDSFLAGLNAVTV